MRTTLRIILLFICITMVTLLGIYLYSPFEVFDCEGGQKRNGWDYEFDVNGNLYSFGKTKDCLWDGTIYYFYPNGQVKSIKQFKNIPKDDIFSKEGTWKEYATNGRLYKENVYLNNSVIEEKIYDTLSMPLR